MRRAVVFNYNSIFCEDIEKTINRYNLLNLEKTFSIDMYKAEKYPIESMAGPADVIIHSGGDGIPVRENLKGIPKLYICYSHQWKAIQEGGKVVQLESFIKGRQLIDVIEDDEILGKKGKIPIMQYHMFGVVQPPRCAKVLATSRAWDASGEEIEIIEALRYPDGSLSIQGHPEEGSAAHIFHNFLRLERTHKEVRVSLKEAKNGTFQKNSKLDKNAG